MHKVMNHLCFKLFFSIWNIKNVEGMTNICVIPNLKLRDICATK